MTHGKREAECVRHSVGGRTSLTTIVREYGPRSDIGSVCYRCVSRPARVLKTCSFRGVLVRAPNAEREPPSAVYGPRHRQRANFTASSSSATRAVIACRSSRSPLTGEHRRSITGEWKKPEKLCFAKDRLYLVESHDFDDYAKEECEEEEQDDDEEEHRLRGPAHLSRPRPPACRQVGEWGARPTEERARMNESVTAL